MSFRSGNSYQLHRMKRRRKGGLQMDTHASEELLAAPLPELIKGLGLAVADANKALQTSEMVYAITEAEIELKIAISIDTASKMDAGASFGLKAFSVNASYSKTYGYKEEASSSIKIKLATVPRNKTLPKPEGT